MSENQSERNKRLVDRFFKEAMHEAEKPDLSVLDEIVHEDYIQHNPLAGQGRAGLKHFIEHVIPTFTDLLPLFATPILDVTLIAEGDMVVRQEMRTDLMIVDIFRIEDGWIREHWEAWHFMNGAVRPSYMKS